MGILFITGIDTGIGKSFATGLLARYLQGRGTSVITQKLVQTGCDAEPGDIAVHRAIMGTGLTDDDLRGLTCPYRFKFPASPHLAAHMESASIRPETISEATDLLAERYEHVIIEGAGGICVPLEGEFTILDYVSMKKYPVIIVTSSRLGSINHTLMTLEMLKSRNLAVPGLLYNLYPPENEAIVDDSRRLFVRSLTSRGYPPVVIDLPVINIEQIPDIDFSRLFNP